MHSSSTVKENRKNTNQREKQHSHINSIGSKPKCACFGSTIFFLAPYKGPDRVEQLVHPEFKLMFMLDQSNITNSRHASSQTGAAEPSYSGTLHGTATPSRMAAH